MDKRELSILDLAFYFRMLAERAGVKWEPEIDLEIERYVNCLINTAVEEAVERVNPKVNP